MTHLKTPRHFAWLYAAAATILLLAAAGGGAGAHQAQASPGELPLLGDSAVHLYAQEAYEAFPDAVTKAVAARHAELVASGMDCARHLFDWAGLEPTPGTYDTDLVIEALDARIESGITHQFCNITVIDSFGAEELPQYIADLLAQGTPWDDPRITGAFARLLDAVVPLMLDRGTYMLGVANEPGGYYTDSPDEAASFEGFVQAAVEHVHSLEPRLACTVVFAGPNDPALPHLMPLVDVATFNRYAYVEELDTGCRWDDSPLRLGRAMSPGGVAAILDELIAASQGKLICIQEFGQSTGWDDAPQTLGPNAGLENQRAVIEALANALNSRRSFFRTVSIWTLNDHTRAGMQYVADAILTEGLPQCYADNVTEVFGPTGLVHSDSDASPKPAFDTFKTAVARGLEQTVPDIAYAEIDGIPLTLDLYLPDQGAGPHPLVVWVHGGGWRAGDKCPVRQEILELLDDGVAVASVNYRLTSDERFAKHTFPAQIHDVKGAVRFLRANADTWNLDPLRFSAWGSSAGGHLVALLGSSRDDPDLEGSVGGNLDASSAVQAVVDYFGPSRLETMGGWHDEDDSPESLLIGHSLGDIKAHWEDPAPPYPELRRLVESAGAYHHVDGDEPPYFIAHGLADGTVPPEQSDALAEILLSSGVRVSQYRVPGAGHSFAAMPSAAARRFLLAALGQVPRAPRKPVGRAAPARSDVTPAKPLPSGVFESPAVIMDPAGDPVGRTPASPSQAGVLVKVLWDACGDDAACLLDLIQGQLDQAQARGLKVALAVADGPSAPPAVKEACQLFSFSYRGEAATMCLPWDPHYLEAKEDLVAALGERFDAHPALAYVYFTGACSTNGIEGHCRVDEAEYSAAGYTERRLQDAYLEILDAYLDAFPTTPIAMEVHALFGSASVWEVLWQHGVGSGRLGLAAWWCSERLSVRGGDTVPVWPLVQSAAATTFAVCQPVGSFSRQPYRFSDPILGLDYGTEGSWTEDDVARAFSDTTDWLLGRSVHVGQQERIVPFSVIEPWSADVARDDFQETLELVGSSEDP